MRMRIYAILENVRIAYIFFHFFAYGQTQCITENRASSCKYILAKKGRPTKANHRGASLIESV